MRMYDLIEKKRCGCILSDEEIRYIIKGYTNSEIPDYQMSAFTMAVFFKGMNYHETAVMTDAMSTSGDVIDLSDLGNDSVDKHSTGGVGDKTTLIVAPLAACLGCKVAKMSGRGLGHTGGTVDKLSSIPGYNISLTPNQFIQQVKDIGVSVIGQTSQLAPADKKLYALRDVTATVESIPLIASSIMSKKLAAGAHSIVLDVKVGNGSFMKNLADAEKLSEFMVRIGYECGRRVTAIISDMSVPLGNTVGNILEVNEAIKVLNGVGPSDLTDVCIDIAAHMVNLCKNIEYNVCVQNIVSLLKNGKALEKFHNWMIAQGAEQSFLDNPSSLLSKDKQYKVVSAYTGYISSMDTQSIGKCAMLLGAGRETKDDIIDPYAGIYICSKTGDFVHEGECIAIFYTNKASIINEVTNLYLSSVSFSEEPIKPHSHILRVINEDSIR